MNITQEEKEENSIKLINEIQENNIEDINKLIPISCFEYNNQEVLYWAIKYSNIDTIKEILKFNSKNFDNKIYINAIKYKNLDALKLLINDAEEHKIQHILEMAMLFNSKKSFYFLIDKVNYKNPQNNEFILNLSLSYSDIEEEEYEELMDFEEIFFKYLDCFYSDELKKLIKPPLDQLLFKYENMKLKDKLETELNDEISISKNKTKRKI